ncbi:hypothetical protein B0H19DRAFT_1115314 [Mycena capillaripes]|nr:hypothetical protein B0H19DRAFT_1115314 [Mycena capillaripes]
MDPNASHVTPQPSQLAPTHRRPLLEGFKTQHAVAMTWIVAFNFRKTLQNPASLKTSLKTSSFQTQGDSSRQDFIAQGLSSMPSRRFKIPDLQCSYLRTPLNRWDNLTGISRTLMPSMLRMAKPRLASYNATTHSSSSRDIHSYARS